MSSLLKSILISSAALLLVACQGQNAGTDAHADTASSSSSQASESTTTDALSIGMVTMKGALMTGRSTNLPGKGCKHGKRKLEPRSNTMSHLINLN